MTCLTADEKKKENSRRVFNIAKELPHKIENTDFRGLEYTFEGFGEIRYPTDAKGVIDSDGVLMNTIDIALNQKFSI